MASFSQQVESKYGISTYQEVKSTYDWIVLSAGKLNLSNLKITERFIFKSGEITYEANNITEFVTHAYGSTDFNLVSFQVYIYDGDIDIASVSYLIDLSVYANNKATLERFVGILHSTSLNATECNDPISIAYITQQNNGVIINGDSNIVTNRSNEVQIPSETAIKKSGIKHWIDAILQNLLANGIWYLSGILVAAVITRIIAKG